jgi:hypothetical protein
MSNVSNAMNNSTAATTRHGLSVSTALKKGAVGGLLAIAGNLLVYVLARYAFAMELLMPPIPPASESAPLIAGAVIFASFIPGLVAGLAYWLLGKFTANPRRVFLIVAALILLGSMAAPLMLPVAVGTMIVLNLMHVVAGVAIVGALTR